MEKLDENCMYSVYVCTFLFGTHISRLIDKNFRKMAKNRDLKTQISCSENNKCIIL